MAGTIWTWDDVTPPEDLTDAQIENALAGVYGPIVARWRWYLVDSNNVSIEEVSHAMILDSEATLSLDNERPVLRTISGISMVSSRLPSFFNPSSDRVSVVEERYMLGAWRQFPLGIFKLEVSETIFDEFNERVLVCDAADLSVTLITSGPSVPYTIASGTTYVSALEEVFGLAGLSYDLSNVPEDTLVVDVTWPPYPETTWMDVVSDLAFGINFYSPWMNSNGVFVTRQRLDPYTETADATYTDTSEPRMISGDSQYIRVDSTMSLPNVCVVLIDNPFHADFGYYMKRNDDENSPLAISVVGERVEQVDYDHDPSTSCVLDDTKALEIADFIVRLADAMTNTASLPTFDDPRRDAHESYYVNVDEEGIGTQLWRVRGWERTLGMSGGPMVHEIGLVRDLTVSDEEV